MIHLVSLVAFVWSAPWLVTRPLAHLGEDVAMSAVLGLTLLVVVLAREKPAFLPRPSTVAAGLVAGSAGYAGWLVLIGAAGSGIGLAPFESPSSTPSCVRVVSVLVFAPVFEELLYRERLLDTLQGRGWPLPTRLLSSAFLFALPHGEPWPILGAALVGVALAAAYEFTRSVTLCVAAHAGLNAAAIVGVGALVAPSLVIGAASIGWQAVQIARADGGRGGRVHGLA